jgi:hypothetical protein
MSRIMGTHRKKRKPNLALIERNKKIVECYEQLRNLREVGKRFGLCFESIRQILKASGIATNFESKPFRFKVPKAFTDNPEVINDLVSRYREVGSVPKVASEFGLHYEVVYWALRKLGVKFTRRPYEERFWERVKRGADNECWLWTGKAVTKGGFYGRMSYIGGVKKQSHHLAWIFTHGEIPKDVWVLHDCGVSLCCNPKHLKLGTPKENAQDRFRHAMERGEWSPKYKPPRVRFAVPLEVAEKIVKWIRVDGMTIKRVVAEHGIKRGTINSVLYKAKWQYLQAVVGK